MGRPFAKIEDIAPKSWHQDRTVEVLMVQNSPKDGDKNTERKGTSAPKSRCSGRKQRTNMPNENTVANVVNATPDSSAATAKEMMKEFLRSPEMSALRADISSSALSSTNASAKIAEEVRNTTAEVRQHAAAIIDANERAVDTLRATNGRLDAAAHAFSEAEAEENKRQAVIAAAEAIGLLAGGVAGGVAASKLLPGAETITKVGMVVFGAMAGKEVAGTAANTTTKVLRLRAKK